MTDKKRSGHGSTSSATANGEAFIKNTVTILKTKRFVVKLDKDRAWKVAESIGFGILYVAIAFIVPTLIVLAFEGW